MKRSVYGRGTIMVGLALSLTVPMAEAACRPDAVQVGDMCMDKFEASVWKTGKRKLIKAIRSGEVTLRELRKAGAVQLGLVAGDLEANGCPKSGNGCGNIFAASVAGVLPAGEISGFQAAAVSRNAHKRLATRAEWLAAALGTPDLPGGMDDEATDCNVNGPPFAVAPTGSRSKCVSGVRAFDMVGNVIEWVSDWVPFSTTCVPSLVPGTDDINCFAGADTTGGPAQLVLGGSFESKELAGVYTISGLNNPLSVSSDFVPLGFLPGILGFRAARALER